MTEVRDLLSSMKLESRGGESYQHTIMVTEQSVRLFGTKISSKACYIVEEWSLFGPHCIAWRSDTLHNRELRVDF
jgi:hypothetical protein